MRATSAGSERPSANAAVLYVGEVMHARLKPMGHRFSYRVMSLLIDLDRLADADRQSPLFGVNRAALYSFHEADHGRRDGSSLRAYAQGCAAARGIDLTGGQVLLLCYPRLFGYTFNPLSVYFCYRADGELVLLIYEVRNTFGDIHPYVLPVTPGEISDAGVRPNSGNRPRRSRPRCNFQWQPSCARHQGVAACVLRPPAGHHEDHGGDPLGGATALAEGRAADAAEGRSPQYRLGDREWQRLYFAGVVHPCQALKQGRSTMRGRVNRHSMDRPCPS
jgi:Protein of unknown function (DUF1365)